MSLLEFEGVISLQAQSYAWSGVYLVFAATVPLPRPFVLGVHRHIPISLSVDGRPSIDYEAPPTIADQLARATEERGAAGPE